MPVSCSNEGCDEVVSKRDVKQHELDLCRFKTTTCDDCGKKMPHHKFGAHGCVLRREMMTCMQRMTTAFEILQKPVNSKSTDIVVIAGWNPKTKKSLSSVERFNWLNQTWTQLPGLKIARQASAAVMFKNQMFVCGGFPGLGRPLDSIEVLDLNGNPPEWHEFIVNLPIKVAAHKCVVHGNRLLIIGGRINPKESLDTIYELLLIPPYSSKLLCHMKKKRASHGVELFDDKVLIAGGNRAETDVEIFDIARNECVEMPPLPSPLSGMSTVRRGNTMLLIGGVDNIDPQKVSNQMIEYDFKTGQSKVLLAMKTGRAYCSCICRGDTLIVIGGVEDNPDTVDCFNFLSNSWKRLPSMAETRMFSSAVLVNMENLEF
jgi:hypothetical protein